MSRIDLEGVSVRFPTTHGDAFVLRETSLSLTERSIALIGANGSGKSTLARLLNGLVTATTGRVLVDGVDVAQDGRSVRRKVGFVFTDPATQLVMPTAAEDIALSLRRSHPDKHQRRAATEAVLASYGLSELGDRSVHTLSGGQRQLLALAGVLAVEPDILVADEPTTLLDLGNARRVGDLLLALRQQLVLVTHDLELAGRCERGLVLADGRIVYDGPAQAAVDHYRAAA